METGAHDPTPFVHTAALVDSIKEYAILVLDPAGLVRTWNEGAREIKGWKDEEIVGRPFACFYPEADRLTGRPEALLAQAAARGRVEEEAFRIRKDGSPFWAGVVITALRDASGELTGFVKVTRDLSERRRAEQRLAAYARQQAVTAELGIEALRAREPRAFAGHVVRVLQDVLVADAVFVLEGDGDRLQVIAAAGAPNELVGRAVPLDPCTFVGHAYLRREVVSVTDFATHAQIVPSELDEADRVRSGVAIAVPRPSGRSAHGVLVVLRHEPHDASEELAFLRGVTNVIAAVIAHEEDERLVCLAEQRAAEQHARSERAQREVLSRDEFIAIAAHELRTPLNALHLNLYALSKALERVQAERIDARIESALRQSARLSQLISRVLDVSRIASGTMDLVREPFDLVRLVRDVVDSLAESASRVGSEVALTTCARAEGRWDRTRLEQVVTNLLSNAIAYGAGNPIDVCVEADATHVRVCVEDHGIGIAPDDLERIFGRFERAVPNLRYAGLGLGLYIAQHIAAAHGGSIGVRSEVGCGTSFLVTLPRQPSDAGWTPRSVDG